jgi:hypothetical protein
VDEKLLLEIASLSPVKHECRVVVVDGIVERIATISLKLVDNSDRQF